MEPKADRGEFRKVSSYGLPELQACAEGRWGDMPKLPRKLMLLISRVTNIKITGDKGEGVVRAEFDVPSDFWVFTDHFKDDPVMPGSFELDALLQLLGLFLGWSGALGKGRATGHGKGKFAQEILPTAGKIEYGVDITRVLKTRKAWFGVGRGWVKLDGIAIYEIDELQVGIFPRQPA